MVYVERGRLAKAHSCLMHAHQLAPHEDYIVKHIQIVQTRLQKLKTQPDSRERELAFSKFDPRDYGGLPVPTQTKTVTPQDKPQKIQPPNLEPANSNTQSDNQPVFIESTTLP